ncbi:hypothetical protein AGMMS50268_36850 [Spirochaetia bacterium]|nr:hypothetical protein AGMMS50268_36850 [Spirochaetia bacterium]
MFRVICWTPAVPHRIITPIWCGILKENRNDRDEIGDSNGYQQTEAGVIPEDWEVKPFYMVSKGRTARPRL